VLAVDVPAVNTVNHLLSPERFLTKICMVSSGSAEEAREETLEMLLERMLLSRASSLDKAVAVISDRGSVDGTVVRRQRACWMWMELDGGWWVVLL